MRYSLHDECNKKKVTFYKKVTLCGNDGDVARFGYPLIYSQIILYLLYQHF